MTESCNRRADKVSVACALVAALSMAAPAAPDGLANLIPNLFNRDVFLKAAPPTISPTAPTVSSRPDKA